MSDSSPTCPICWGPARVVIQSGITLLECLKPCQPIVVPSEPKPYHGYSAYLPATKREPSDWPVAPVPSSLKEPSPEPTGIGAIEAGLKEYWSRMPVSGPVKRLTYSDFTELSHAEIDASFKQMRSRLIVPPLPPLTRRDRLWRAFWQVRRFLARPLKWALRWLDPAAVSEDA